MEDRREPMGVSSRYFSVKGRGRRHVRPRAGPCGGNQHPPQRCPDLDKTRREAGLVGKSLTQGAQVGKLVWSVRKMAEGEELMRTAAKEAINTFII